MNEQNFEFLSKQIKYSGFGEGHADALKQKMQEGTAEFTLFHQQQFGKDSTVATLQFRKPENSDMYFFNRYELLLKKDGQQEPSKQSFFVHAKEDNVTLKEAYNLMSGRAVYKELVNQQQEKYPAWVQLDFSQVNERGNFKMRQFNSNYGFDLAANLQKYPIRELQQEQDRSRLMESLQRGNRQAVTLDLSGGKEFKAFVEAVPQFKSLQFYDGSQQKINVAKLLGETMAQSNTMGVKQEGAGLRPGEPQAVNDETKQLANGEVKQSSKLDKQETEEVSVVGEQDGAGGKKEKKVRKKGMRL